MGQKNLWIWPDSNVNNFRNQKRKEVELFFWNGLRLLSRIYELEIFGSRIAERVGSLPVSWGCLQTKEKVNKIYPDKIESFHADTYLDKFFLLIKKTAFLGSQNYNFYVQVYEIIVGLDHLLCS